MAWFYLIIAGLFEVGWAVSLRYTEAFTRLWPSALFGVSMALSVWLLALALKTIPIGTGYAVWTGIGAAGTAVIGIAFYGEAATTLRLVLLTVLIGSIMGLKLASAE